MKPQIVIAPSRLNGLDRTTSESRKRMTVAEIIEAMGEKHVNHPDFKPKSRSLIQPPNLANLQPTIQRTDCGIFGQMKAAFFWMLR